MKGSFRKRGNSWSFSVDIGRDPETGKRKQKTKSGYKTKKEAQKACAELITQYETGSYIEPTKQKVHEYLEEWLQYKEKKVKSSTYRKYVLSIHHLEKEIGDIPLSELTAKRINYCYDALLDKGLSDTFVADIHILLKSALKQANDWELIIKNPANMVDKPRVVKKEMKVWDQEQAQIFLAHAKKHKKYIAFHLALATGMRKGEILGLRWKDINFEESTLSVIQTLSNNGKEFYTEPKTSSSRRVIHLDPVTVKELKKHRLKQKVTNGLVVTTSKGNQVHPSSLLRAFDRVIEKAGVEKIRFHDTRHTHATLLLMQKVNPKIVSERLGHSSVLITLNTYTHLLPNLQEETAKNFGEAFFG